MEQMPYRAFLLRCWQEKTTGQTQESSWRFALREVGSTGLQRAFANLDDLRAFLDRELQNCEWTIQEVEVNEE
jgi:hypothetical protein